MYREMSFSKLNVMDETMDNYWSKTKNVINDIKREGSNEIVFVIKDKAKYAFLEAAIQYCLSLNMKVNFIKDNIAYEDFEQISEDADKTCFRTTMYKYVDSVKNLTYNQMVQIYISDKKILANSAVIL